MNEASGGCEETPSKNTQSEAKKAEQKITSGGQRKGKEFKERGSGKGAQGRPHSSKPRRNPKSKDKKETQDKTEVQSTKDDKDVISWLNKKITKPGESGAETELPRNSKPPKKTKTPNSQSAQNRTTVSKVENWRNRDLDMKGESESSRENGKYRKSEQEKFRRDERFRQQPSPALDFDKRKDPKQFNADGGGRKKFQIGKQSSKHQTEKSFQSNKKEKSHSEDVVEIGSNVNVVDGKYVGRDKYPEQHDNGNAMEMTHTQYEQYTDIGSQPQVYVYGGLHVYNMPYTNQQYYPDGQQWHGNYGDQQYQNWNQTVYQPLSQKINDTKFPESKNKEITNSKTYSRKFKEQKNSITVDPNHSVQASSLTEQLVNESYECMVCCEKIRCHAPVWSCTNCYHVFHLRCVRKWANSPAALIEGEYGGWRCPACQNINQSVPNVYNCFCGKSIDPMWNPREGITPHSCGELCQKKRESSDCPHLCNQLCHPGPCPSCPVMVAKACMCGKITQQTRCGQATIIQCKEVCGKTLNCGVHCCDSLCHTGACGSCEVDEEQTCYCGNSTRQTKCGAGEMNDNEGRKGYFSCDKICERHLDCGNHKCERPCHKGKCNPCKLKPSNVMYCPCGKTTLEKLLTEQRQSCLDPIPTCNNICNKMLPCSPTSGKVSSQHRCKLTCHHGDCGTCDGKTTLVCRCGAATKEINCSDINSEVYLCNQRCNKKRQCGRHRCNQKCCVDKEHRCELLCGKKLRCGTHHCDEPCHRGYCSPCFMTGFQEVTCHCGSTVMYPPIPCGTPPPECNKPCSRLHPCSHTVNHSCHSEEVCPPCTVLTKKMCSGNHQLRLNVPCHVTDVSCGKPCGSKLKCGHSCIKLCHKPPCDSEPCTQPCKEERKECGHPCGVPCHYGSPCPDAPCQVKITITCKCGRRSETVPCLQGGDKTALAQFYRRMTTESLANKMKDVQLGQSVDISVVVMLDDKAVRYIECNDECAHSERARRMAEALGVDENVEPFGTPYMLYSPFLMNEAKNNLTFIKTIEQAFENLVTIAQKLPSGQKRHSFPPMNSNQRRIIHELAVHYICSSVSYDAEPKRNTVITATKASRLPPSTLSSQIERQKNPPAPPPVPYVPSDAMAKARMIKESKEEKKSKTWAQVPDYFADDFND